LPEEENGVQFSNFIPFQRALLEENRNQMLNVAMFIYLGFIRCLVLPVSAETRDIQQAEIGSQDLAGWPGLSSIGLGHSGPNKSRVRGN
jgi:hypothetical protein